MAGSQLAIPFSAVQNSLIIFEKPYEFTVSVVWAKPDGLDVRKTRTVTIYWYDL